jgi:membrane protein implicated in regulation of membrane protease activity
MNNGGTGLGVFLLITASIWGAIIAAKSIGVALGLGVTAIGIATGMGIIIGGLAALALTALAIYGVCCAVSSLANLYAQRKFTNALQKQNQCDASPGLNAGMNTSAIRDSLRQDVSQPSVSMPVSGVAPTPAIAVVAKPGMLRSCLNWFRGSNAAASNASQNEQSGMRFSSR